MTPTIKKILYATDLSPNSAYALGFALNSATLYHAEVVILHVIDRPTFGYSGMVPIYVDERNFPALSDEYAKDIEERVRKRLEIIHAEEIRDNPKYEDTKISIEICEGYPAEAILRLAHDVNCDMIIMGTHGKGILGNTFLGSNAKKVLRRTRKPIMIIPLPKGELDITVQDASVA